MNRILVRPAHKDLIVLDDLSRRIPYKEGGAFVNRTPLIGRLIEDKDLIDLDIDKRRKEQLDKIKKEKAEAAKEAEKKAKLEAEEKLLAEAKAKKQTKKKEG